MTTCPQCGEEFKEELERENLTTLSVEVVDKICFSPSSNNEDKVYFHH